ncbi:MAG: hypothetical protein ABI690_30635 [Chloroflexota bacterium]
MMVKKDGQAVQHRFVLLMTLIAFLLATALAVYSTQRISSIPMRNAGHTSISSILTHATILVSLMVTALSLRRFNPEYYAIKPMNQLAVIFRWGSRAGILLAVVFVVTLLATLLLYLISNSMADRSLSTQAVIGITAIYGAVLGFALANWTSKLNYQHLFWLTGTAMVVGLSGAIVLAPDNAWWTGVLSFLGIGPSAWVFDLTFIVGGLLLLIVIDDKLDDLEILRANGQFQSSHFKSYRIVLTASAIAMMGIGLFPFTGLTLRLHQIASTYAVLSFLVISPAFIWVLPIYSSLIRVLSILPLLMALMTFAAYFLMHLKFSLLELIFIGLIMVWVMTFYYTTRTYILKMNPDLERD